jgi:CsoR family transcriptional regulator, copper-sensing transcriptional repressor
MVVVVIAGLLSGGHEAGVARIIPPMGMMAAPEEVDVADRGYSMDKDDYRRRLRRIEGQVRGIERMIEEDTYCIDVLTQVAAATKALQSVAVGLLDQHVRHCVANAGADEAADMITEATRAIERLIKA